MLALRTGKPALVERPFTMNAAEAREFVDAARARGLSLMEAMRTRRGGPPDASALPAAPVPYDTSLNAGATAAAIVYELPSVRELLSELRRQRKTGEIRPLATQAEHTPKPPARHCGGDPRPMCEHGRRVRRKPMWLWTGGRGNRAWGNPIVRSHRPQPSHGRSASQHLSCSPPQGTRGRGRRTSSRRSDGQPCTNT